MRAVTLNRSPLCQGGYGTIDDRVGEAMLNYRRLRRTLADKKRKGERGAAYEAKKAADDHKKLLDEAKACIGSKLDPDTTQCWRNMRSQSVARIGLAPNVKHEVVRQMDTLRRSLTSMKPKVVSWMSRDDVERIKLYKKARLPPSYHRNREEKQKRKAARRGSRRASKAAVDAQGETPAAEQPASVAKPKRDVAAIRASINKKTTAAADSTAAEGSSRKEPSKGPAPVITTVAPVTVTRPAAIFTEWYAMEMFRAASGGTKVSGSLTLTQFEAHLEDQPWAVSYMSSDKLSCRDLWTQYDSNNDGELTEDEFKRMFLEKLQPMIEHQRQMREQRDSLGLSLAPSTGPASPQASSEAVLNTPPTPCTPPITPHPCTGCRSPVLWWRMQAGLRRKPAKPPAL